MIKKIINSKAFYIAASIVVAIGLWIYVVGVVNPYVEDVELRNIPVVFVGEQEMLEKYSTMITDGKDVTISAKFSGKRSDVAKLTTENVRAVVDVSSTKSSGNSRLPYEIEIPEDEMSEDVKKTQTSFYINVFISEIKSRDIAVEGIFVGGAAEDYMTEPLVLSPEMITVTGPNELITNIYKARVTLERYDATRSTTLDLSYEFIDRDGNIIESDYITSDTEKIAVTQTVLMLKKLKLTVDFVDGGGATTTNVVSSINPTHIEVAGDAATLEGKNSISLGTIDLGAVLSGNDSTDEYPTETYQIEITLPDNVKILTEFETDTPTAEVTVTLKGLKTKYFGVTQIELLNAPEGYTVERKTNYIQVTVRASEEIIDKIAANNIRAVADLSTIKSTGTTSVPVDIFIDGYSNAGVIGSYTIIVTITEESDEPAPDDTQTANSIFW